MIEGYFFMAAFFMGYFSAKLVFAERQELSTMDSVLIGTTTTVAGLVWPITIAALITIEFWERRTK